MQKATDMFMQKATDTGFTKEPIGQENRFFFWYIMLIVIEIIALICVSARPNI